MVHCVNVEESKNHTALLQLEQNHFQHEQVMYYDFYSVKASDWGCG